MSVLFQLRVGEMRSRQPSNCSKAAREGIGVLTKPRQKVQASEPNARGKLMPPYKERRNRKHREGSKVHLTPTIRSTFITSSAVEIYLLQAIKAIY